MPLIIISGYPSSGKTYRANQLATYFTSKIQPSSSTTTSSESPTSTTPSSSSTPPTSVVKPPFSSRLTVHHINDQILAIPRTAYRDAPTEKEARGAQYAAIKRALGRDTIVIADGLNYIKGFRYQLYCEAKAARTTSCVVHIGTPIDKCREINQRQEQGGYEPDIFDNLVYRYEEPNGMTRWDSPLFTVPFDDEAPPCDAIWDAMIGSEGKPKVVKPNTATVLQPATASDYLYELDKITQEVLNGILAWQKDHPGEGGQVGGVQLPGRPVSLPQLQRVRRQFIALNRLQKTAEERIRPSFVEYLNINLG